MIPNVKHQSQNITEIQQNFFYKVHHRKSTEMQSLTLALTWGREAVILNLCVPCI